MIPTNTRIHLPKRAARTNVRRPKPRQTPNLGFGRGFPERTAPPRHGQCRQSPGRAQQVPSYAASRHCKGTAKATSAALHKWRTCSAEAATFAYGSGASTLFAAQLQRLGFVQLLPWRPVARLIGRFLRMHTAAANTWHLKSVEATRSLRVPKASA